MSEVIPIILYIVMGLIVLVLVAGMASMWKGGSFNKRFGNKLMRSRVALQALAVLLLALMFFVFQSSD